MPAFRSFLYNVFLCLLLVSAASISDASEGIHDFKTFPSSHLRNRNDNGRKKDQGRRQDTGCRNKGDLISGAAIPKYETDLFIPPVLHDDRGAPSFAEISFRQIKQQVLPEGYPATDLWAYGDPSDPRSFHNPSGTVEVTKDTSTVVNWINDLVNDPDECRCNPHNDHACKYIPHVLQDENCLPVIDQTLHWAAPNRRCANFPNGERTDCRGDTDKPYRGPVPMTVHVHGAHVEPKSDGYPESWYLPRASNIPKGFASYGRLYPNGFQGQVPLGSCEWCKEKDVHRVLSSSSSKESTSKTSSSKKSTTEKSTSSKTSSSKKSTTKKSSSVDTEESSGTGSSTTNKSSSGAYDSDDSYEPPGRGYNTHIYSNDQPTAAIWYHDHALGITRLNVYAGAAGFWIIRDKHDRETGMLNAFQKLPGPPPMNGEDPNGDESVRKTIREIPIAIQPKSFYEDGRQFYPANRAYFEGIGKGTNYADNDGLEVKFLPDEGDIAPVWNPEAFFDTMVVNGNTWPKLKVAPERYRFRLLNAADSRFLNLSLKKQNGDEEELPFFVIGNDQSLLPEVIRVSTGKAERVSKITVSTASSSSDDSDSDDNSSDTKESSETESTEKSSDTESTEKSSKIGESDSTSSTKQSSRSSTKKTESSHESGSTKKTKSTESSTSSSMSSSYKSDSSSEEMTSRRRRLTEEAEVDPLQALLMGPSERYDVIVDFSSCKHGDEILMLNTGPDSPFGGFEDGYEPADKETTGQVMKFIVDKDYKCDHDDCKHSTDPFDLRFDSNPGGKAYYGKADETRDLALLEEDSEVTEGFGPKAALLGIDGNKGPEGAISLLWSSPIEQNPKFGNVEIWEFWNWSADAHIIHVHLVNFQVIDRQTVGAEEESDSSVAESYGPQLMETGWKDSVVTYPGEVTRIKAKFDIRGLYVWHCHLLSHEDNEMMLPFCVGDCHEDCFEELCKEK